jgi:hypothetical protein
MESEAEAGGVGEVEGEGRGWLDVQPARAIRMREAAAQVVPRSFSGKLQKPAS